MAQGAEARVGEELYKTDGVVVDSLILTASVSPIALVVSLFTWSIYSHCYFVLSDGSCIDAHPKYGVSRRKRKKAMFEKEYDLSILSMSNRRKLFIRLNTRVGKPYDWPWIIGYPFNRNWQDEDSWVCFELAATVLRGIIEVDKQLHRITGRHLARALDRWKNV